MSKKIVTKKSRFSRLLVFLYHFPPLINLRMVKNSYLAPYMVQIWGTFLPFYALPAAPSPPGGASAASILEDSRGSWLRHLQGLELQNEGFRNFWRRGSESRNFFSRKWPVRVDTTFMYKGPTVDLTPYMSFSGFKICRDICRNTHTVYVNIGID